MVLPITLILKIYLMVTKMGCNIDFDKIFIERGVVNHKKTKLILSRLDFKGEIEYFDDINTLIKSSEPVYHPCDRAKQLVLSSIRGGILRKCPGTHGHICCNYHVINQYIGCPVNCSYCILQGYLNQPFTIINVDIENIFTELDKHTSDNIIRVGTGELGDSLVYDHLTDFSLDFIEYFSDRRQYCFEFKTKTDNIGNLIKHKNPGNIIVGFSVNPEIIQVSDEPFAATLNMRLEAARKLASMGYRVSLHFDPIINIENYEDLYNNLVKMIFSYITPEDIGWISLGTFRYTNELKSMMEYNYPNSKLLSDEFVLCADAKYRYYRPLRTRLYRTVKNALSRINPDMPVYLCMESPEIWKAVLGHLPDCSGKMDFLFKSRGIIK